MRYFRAQHANIAQESFKFQPVSQTTNLDLKKDEYILLENETGMRGRWDNERILVVVQGQEASIERKIGGDKEVPNVST